MSIVQARNSVVAICPCEKCILNRIRDCELVHASESRKRLHWNILLQRVLIMTRSILYGLVVFSILLFAPPTDAGEVGVQVVFTDGEASIIRAYYDDQGAPQNGQGKNSQGKHSKGLPPGIAKNLQRGKPLPPGIAKQALPTGLIDLLPPAPKGYERVVLSGKVLLVDIATQVIQDVLEDVILG